MTIARQELAPFSEKDETRVRIEGPQVLLEPNIAQTIAIALHELATNAAKYGSLSVPNGRTALTWSHEANGQLILCWSEVGGPTVQMPKKRGFGTRVIERLIGQVHGNARFDWRTEGPCLPTLSFRREVQP